MSETFQARLESEGDGLFVLVPDDVMSRLSQKRRPPVLVTVNGFTFASTPAIYGGKAYVGFRRQVRQAAGLRAGEVLAVSLALDRAERTVEPPTELESRLDADGEARRRFQALSHTHRREYCEWVGSARRVETRASRAERTLEMLRNGIRTPQEARSGRAPRSR